jgi:formylglycine-generating enzyme required for sulfatase activity
MIARRRPGAARALATTAVAVVMGLSACGGADHARPPAGAAADFGSTGLPDLVEIAAGPFVMGADAARDPQAFDNERWPAGAGEGLVDVPLFYIGRHEVTVAQFADFVRATSWTVDARALAGPPDHPVTFVSWPDALAYCRWLDAGMKRSPVTPRHVARLLHEGWRITLPDEAEWEKAARGTDRRVFPWGYEPRPDRANFGGSGTRPVGGFPCLDCAHGLSDLSGIVWEWTRSPNRPYPYDPAADRASLGDDALWVMRGGHYGDGARMVRTTTRGAAEPGARRPFIGFRVALTQPAPSRR